MSFYTTEKMDEIRDYVELLRQTQEFLDRADQDLLEGDLVQIFNLFDKFTSGVEGGQVGQIVEFYGDNDAGCVILMNDGTLTQQPKVFLQKIVQ